jgi:hypothetical protein
MSSYNIFDILPSLPYNCISYLMENSSLAWKLLAYNDAEAWKSDGSHPDLTQTQKGELVYDGLKNQTSCRVFMTTGLDSAWMEQNCQLRISILSVEPVNYVVGYTTIAMEIYPHFLVSQLSNYMTRADMLAQELIRVFNGSDVGGLGKLYFDASKNPRSRMSVIGNPPFVGKGIVFCNWTV